jgi:hypothetical protein
MELVEMTPAELLTAESIAGMAVLGYVALALLAERTNPESGVSQEDPPRRI